MPRIFVKLNAVLPFVVAGVVGTCWLNQGVSHARALTITSRTAMSLAHPLDAARHVLTELYERTGDEEIHYAVAHATRGLPYDEDRLAHRGHDTPASFDRAPPADGAWHRPYAEVPFEYPAAMLPFVVLPSFVAGETFEGFTRVFGVFMTLLMLGAAALAVRGASEDETRRRGWALVALFLAQGSLLVQRLDAVPALLLAWAYWAAVRRRPATTGVALGLATAAKMFPAFLVPLLVAADLETWRTPRTRRRGLVGFGTAAAVGFLPMLFPPTALLDLLRYHSARGLHAESTGGVLLAFGRLFAPSHRPATLSFGSYNLDGASAASIATLCTPLMVLLLVATTTYFARAERVTDETDRADRLAVALLAGLALLWLSAKTFSPQYLTWALPLVLSVSGARGRLLTWMLALIMAITQVYMRTLYGQVIEGTPIGVGVLVLRLPLLVMFGWVALTGARCEALPVPSPRRAQSEPDFASSR